MAKTVQDVMGLLADSRSMIKFSEEVLAHSARLNELHRETVKHRMAMDEKGRKRAEGHYGSYRPLRQFYIRERAEYSRDMRRAKEELRRMRDKDRFSKKIHEHLKEFGKVLSSSHPRRIANHAVALSREMRPYDRKCSEDYKRLAKKWRAIPE